MARLSCILLAALATGQEEERPRRDLYGDPLPEGAIARIETIRPRQGGPVHPVAFSPDGRTLVAGSADCMLHLWDPANGKAIRTLSEVKSCVRSVAFSPDGKTLASGSSDGTIRLWNPATAKVVDTLVGHTMEVSCLAYSPDGKTLASGSSDATIRLWDPVLGKASRTLSGHTDFVTSIAFSPDGTTLASTSSDRTIRLWDLARGMGIRTLVLVGEPDDAPSVAFSPDGKTLVSGRHDRTIRLWDLASGRETRSLSGHTGSVTAVSYSPDGKILGTGSNDHTIRLWDLATGKAIRTLAGHSDSVSSIAFSPDGRTLASGSSDTTVLVWNLAPKDWDQKRDLDALWVDLLSGDAATAYRATWGFSAQDEAVPFVRTSLFPAATGDDKRFRELLDRLSDPSIEARDDASKELAKSGVENLVLLRKAREKSTDAEVGTQIDAIVSGWEEMRYPEAIRRSRAIRALELTGSDEAMDLLRDVAARSPLERERREAQAALGRLSRAQER